MSAVSTAAPSSCTSDEHRAKNSEFFSQNNESQELQAPQSASLSRRIFSENDQDPLSTSLYTTTLTFSPDMAVVTDRCIDTRIMDSMRTFTDRGWLFARAANRSNVWMLRCYATTIQSARFSFVMDTHPRKLSDEEADTPSLWSEPVSCSEPQTADTSNQDIYDVSEGSHSPRTQQKFFDATKHNSDTPLLTLSELVSAPEFARARFVIRSPDSTASLKDKRLIQTGVNCEAQPWTIKNAEVSFVFLHETAKIKQDHEAAFINACNSFCQLQTKNSQLLGMELLQDLDTLRADSVYFVEYFFLNDAAAREYRKTDSWRCWRRSIAAYYDGTPVFKTFETVYFAKSGLLKTAMNFGSQKSEQCQNNTKPICSTLDVGASLENVKPGGLTLDIVQKDERLKPFQNVLLERLKKYREKRDAVLRLPVSGILSSDLRQCSASHLHFGLQFSSSSWVLREWIPNAKQVYIAGDFNNWNATGTALRREAVEAFGEDVWVLYDYDLSAVEKARFHHLSRYKFYIETRENQLLARLPPCAEFVSKEPDSEIRNALVWNPPTPFTFRNPQRPVPSAPKIYEVYIGLCPNRLNEKRFGKYTDGVDMLVNRICKLGYNTVLLIGVMEHTLGSMGWDTTNYLAPTSQFGTPEELMNFIDVLHGHGLSVIASVVHSHAAAASDVGLHELEGTDAGFFYAGARGRHAVWNGRLFDFEKPQVCRFLLGHISVLITKYRFDGLRFEGVTSLLFRHHGIGRHFDLTSQLTEYFCSDIDLSAMSYLMLANVLVHAIAPSAVTIASDKSRAPTVGVSVTEGGLGFDYCFCPSLAYDKWVQQMQRPDDEWDIASVVAGLEERRSIAEKCIVAPETCSTSLFGRRRLRIAMFAWESLHTHAVGGVAPHVTELTAGLARLGHDVHVFVRATGSVPVHSVHYGVHYHECPFQLNRDFIAETESMCSSFVWHMKETERFLHYQFDICHAHDWLASRALLQAMQSDGQRHGILTIHSTEYGRCGNRRYASGDSKKISDIEREACHSCERIICVSGVLAEEVVSLYNVHRNKIQVIYNGINAEKFDGFEDAAPIKATYAIPPLDPMFLFVGRLTVQKGPDLLLEAVPHILRFRNDAKFVFVGDGYMRSELIARSKALGVSGSCRFTGVLTGQNLVSIFKAADAVVVPSRNEPFGIVVLEAWAAFKPVVATTCGGPRDFVTPNVDGVLVDPEVSSIAWGCCEILKNFDHARWMGQRGRVKAAYNFSWNNIAELTERVYFEQLNRHDTPIVDNESFSDGPLVWRLMGSDMLLHMGVFEGECSTVVRGVALHKIIRLLSLALGGQGYLNFMGNEFGHPEHIDVPRNGNGFCFDHRFLRQYTLASDTLLKYKHLDFFDACVIRLETALQWLRSTHQYVVLKSQEDKIIAFERGDCLFVVNLHEDKSYEGYRIGHSLGRDLCLVLDTDDAKFGGFGRLTPGYTTLFPNLEPSHQRSGSVKLYIPNRTALVLTTVQHVAKIQADPVLCCKDADTYIQHC